MNGIFQYLDMFGSTIELRFNQKVRNSTPWGGFITITIFCLMIAGIGWYGDEVINRTQPESLYLEESTYHPERVNIGTRGLNFAFGVQNALTGIEFYDESYFTVKMEWLRLTKVFNETSKSYQQEAAFQLLDLVPCTKEHFKQPGTEAFFLSLPDFEQKICISLEDLEKYQPYVQGDFVSDHFSQLAINVYECDESNPDNPIKCQSKEEREASLMSTYFVLEYPDNLIQLNNYETPFQPFGRDHFTPVSSRLTKVQNLYFRNFYIKTDIGFLFQDVHIQKQVAQVKEISETVLYRQPDDFGKTAFFRIEVRMEKAKNSIYLRRYQKIQNLVPELGGLLKILTTFGFFICWPFSLLNLRINMVQSHYDLKFTPDPSEAQKTSLKSYKPFNLDFSTSDYIFYYIYPFKELRNQKKLLTYCNNKLSKHLDTEHLTQKMVDIEKVKQIMLDDNQIELFDYIPKPIVKAYEVVCDGEDKKADDKSEFESALLSYKQKDIYHIDERKLEEQTRTAFQAFQEINAQKTKTIVDRKLIGLLDPQVIEACKKELGKDFVEDQFQIGFEDQGENNHVRVVFNDRPSSMMQVRKINLSERNIQDETPYISPREESVDQNVKLVAQNISGIPQRSVVPKRYNFG